MEPSNKKVDWEISKRVSDAVDARLGECLANAIRAFLDFPEVLPRDAIFIEGIYSYGGQFAPHTWIEGADYLLDLSLVHDTNYALSMHVQYYPIRVRSKKEIDNIYGNLPRTPGSRILMKTNFDDPEVVRLLNEVDTPPALRS